jgi:hypothetical protein
MSAGALANNVLTILKQGLIYHRPFDFSINPGSSQSMVNSLRLNQIG